MSLEGGMEDGALPLLNGHLKKAKGTEEDNRKRWRDEIQNFWDKTNWYADAREREQWRHHAEAFVQ